MKMLRYHFFFLHRTSVWLEMASCCTFYFLFILKCPVLLFLRGFLLQCMKCPVLLFLGFLYFFFFFFLPTSAINSARIASRRNFVQTLLRRSCKRHLCYVFFHFSELYTF